MNHDIYNAYFDFLVCELVLASGHTGYLFTKECSDWDWDYSLDPEDDYIAYHYTTKG